MSESLEELESAIGSVNILWTDLHHYIFNLFCFLLKQDRGAAGAIFFSVQSDRSQRNMVAALAKSRYGENSDNTKKIIQCLEEANQLAGRRNDIIHSIWDWTPSDDYGVLEISNRRLSKKDWRDEMRFLSSQISVASIHMFMLLRSLSSDTQNPLAPGSQRD